ncbi:hypothetical protein Glove_184g101 [Diversispora epigaea]|uniref:Uncharacterized protein n=1 Tax=Diversispora epigaea TaxID=1348612 RepID=A0A397ISD6_9GLOM|nr:hypothetical protein Glove_184g101 [Diversispora epigaea]
MGWTIDVHKTIFIISFSIKPLGTTSYPSLILTLQTYLRRQLLTPHILLILNLHKHPGILRSMKWNSDSSSVRYHQIPKVLLQLFLSSIQFLVSFVLVAFHLSAPKSFWMFVKK